MKCEVCGKPAMENKIICSEHCDKIRIRVFDLDKKYFPTHGCENCWGDLHGRCTDKCRKEFEKSTEFGKDLWNLVGLVLKEN